MPRTPLLRTNVFPYHVYARSNNRDWFYLPPEEVWDVFCEILGVVTEKYGIEIHSFVMMSNHFHLLLSTPKENLDEAMRYLLRETCRSVNRSAGRINHLFGGPYKWSVIPHGLGYAHALKYIYRNPVKAGMCARVEDYPYSSLGVPLGKEKARFPIYPCRFDAHPLLLLPLEQRLSWLNLAYSQEEQDCVRRALRRRELKFSAHRLSKRLPLSLSAK